MDSVGATAATRPVLMTRRERREAEERARAAARLASGSSGDTVVVGGITFHGPAPISPAVGTPAVPRGRHAPAAAARDLPAPSAARELPDVPAPRNVPEPPQPRRLTVVPRAHVIPRTSHETTSAAPATPPAPATPVTPGTRQGRSFGVVAPTAVAPHPADPAPPLAPASRPTLPRPDAGTRAERAGRTRPSVTDAAPAVRGRARLPRLALLGVLAAATIAAPLTQFGASSGDGSPFDLDLAPTGPSTLDVVSARVAVPQVSAGIAAAPVITREPISASRSEDRDPLPGCDATGTTTSTNGGLGSDELCDLPFAPGEQLSSRAAVALTALNDAFRSEFGWDLTLADSYRSLGEQYAVKRSRGYLAAKPGTSMHGLGLAIDLGSAVTGNKAAYQWLVENGAAYGWENPSWARRGGSGNYEPWHFEYRPGVEALSTGS